MQSDESVARAKFENERPLRSGCVTTARFSKTQMIKNFDSKLNF